MARWLRVGSYAGFLALILANVVEQFLSVPPGGVSTCACTGLSRARTNRQPLAARNPLPGHHGAVRGRHPLDDLAAVRDCPGHARRRHRCCIALGPILYAAAPLGFSKPATNPWLPGSDTDPLVPLAWLLLFGGPVAAGVLADRGHAAPSS